MPKRVPWLEPATSDQGILFFGGVGVLPDEEPLLSGPPDRDRAEQAAKPHPSLYSCTGDSEDVSSYQRVRHEPVQEDRLRQRRIWTPNVSKIQRMEYDRLQSQARRGLDEYIPDYSRGCTNAIHLRIFAGKNRLMGAECNTELLVKCGRTDCYQCASHRRRMWAARAFAEIMASPRTWFVTLTASQESMTKWLSAAEVEYSPGCGRNLALWQYDATVKAGYRDIQLWKKRVGLLAPRLRFLVTVEKHTGKRTKTASGKVSNGDYLGLPHFHMFVHERDTPVSWRKLKANSERIGLSEIKLVDRTDEKAAWYICKYLSKDNGSRNLWPSFRYGRLTNGDLDASVEEFSDNENITDPPE